MSAPRAARKGGKVVSSESPPVEAATTSPASIEVPASSDGAGTPNSAGAADTNLFSSFMQSASAIATAAPIGGGVVRGRGLVTNLKEIQASADRTDVESRVKAAIEGITVPGPAPSLVSIDSDSVPAKHILHSDVTLASDFERLSIALKLAQANPKHRVLVVSPNLAVSDAELCATALNSKIGDAVGLWDGSFFVGSSKYRLLFTNLPSFIVYLKKVRSTPGFGVYTHILFSNCVHAGRALPDLDIALGILRDELRNTVRDLSPKVVICGSTRDDFGAFFDPLRCVELHTQNGARKGSLNVFTADETAALCAVSMKTTGTSSIPRGPTTAAEPIPIRVIEHANDTARLVLHLLVEQFDGAKPMRAVVFSPEPQDFERVLARVNFHEHADVETTLSKLAASGELPRHHVAIVGASTTESMASAVRANVVIDLGMEKRLVAAPAAEATLPLKATVRATSREVNCRLHMLGWGTNGVAFQILAGPPATSACEEDQQAVVTASVLRGIRNGLPLSNIKETIFRASQAHLAAVESGLAVLTEQCAISSAERPAVTFIGDFLARLPLPTDAGLIALHGVVFGFPEAAAAVAAAVAVDVRGHCPTGVQFAAWIQKCEAFAKTHSASQFSDVLVGASIIIKAAKATTHAVDAVAAETGANPASLERALQTFKSVCRELKDYAIMAQSTEATLLAQLDKYQSHFIYIIAASLSRHAAVVRAEADELRAAHERANMMMQRTTKEVSRNLFSPPGVKWGLQQVVVPANITNTQGRFIASNVTTLSHHFFHSALLLLHPALSFDLVNEDTVLFCANINRNPKRLNTDPATSAKVLDFREKWCQLLGVAMLKRSLPRDTTAAQLHAAVAANHRRLDISVMREEICGAFLHLVQDIETKEAQLAPALSRSNLLAATQLADIPVTLGSDDEVLLCVFEGKAAATASDTAAAEQQAAEPAAQVLDDDVEVEGATFAPIIEED